MLEQETTEPFKFRGFKSPNYTNFPDEAIDELMPILSGAEWKVLSYIIRRTFGFKKDSDNISFSQICNGITTKEGKVLDHGTGLSKSTAQVAIKGLEEKEIVFAIRRSSKERGFEATCYSLNLQNPPSPYTENRHSPPIPENGIALYRKSVRQETVLQKTDKESIHSNRLVKSVEKDSEEPYSKEGDNAFIDSVSITPSSIPKIPKRSYSNTDLISGLAPTSSHPERATKSFLEQKSVSMVLKHQSPTLQVKPAPKPKTRRVSKEDREHIREYFLTFLKTKLNDDNVDGSIGQAINIFGKTNLSKEMFFTKVEEAVKATLKSPVKKNKTQEAAYAGQKNRVPYFFTTLRGRCGLSEPP